MPQGTGETRRAAVRWLLSAAVIAACMLAASAVFARNTIYLFGVDDAAIYWRYARNLLQGEGLVWNAGGERVEGFTSPLWLIVSAAALHSTANHEAALRLASGALLAGGLALYCLALLDALQLRRRGAVVCLSLLLGLWCFADPNYTRWQIFSLMETAMWSALLPACAALLYSAVRRGRASPWFLAVLALTAASRPEGAAFALLAAAVFTFALHAVGVGGRELRAAAAPPFAAALAAAAALTAARRIYFGYPFPNTYYAKVGDECWYNVLSGVRYLLHFLGAYPPAAPALGIAAVLALVFHRSLRRSAEGARCLQLLAGISGFFLLAAACVYTCLGGDHFRQLRFYLPFWPFVLVTLLAPVPLLSARPRARRYLLYPLLAASLLLFGRAVLQRALAADPGIHEFALNRAGQQIGAALNEIYPGPQRPSIGVLIAGGVSYRYAGPSLDLLGLNDTRIAHATRRRRGTKNHAAFSPRIIFPLLPDLIIAAPQLCSSAEAADPLPGSWTEEKMRLVNRLPAYRSAYAAFALSSGALSANGGAVCVHRRLGAETDYPMNGSARRLGERPVQSRESR